MSATDRKRTETIQNNWEYEEDFLHLIFTSIKSEENFAIGGYKLKKGDKEITDCGFLENVAMKVAEKDEWIRMEIMRSSERVVVKGFLRWI